MPDVLEPVTTLEVTPEFALKIASMSWMELLTKRHEWESQRTERGADQRVIDVHVDAIDALLPMAYFRSEEIPAWWIELSPWVRLIHSGKVRNTSAHPTNTERLIVVNTDRISTHDVVHDAVIPWKGENLKSVSDYWVTYFASHPNTSHIPTQRVLTHEGISEWLPSEFQWKRLESRTNVFRKLKPFPIEAIVRGYLYGSAFEGYEKVQKGYLSVKNKETGKWELGEYVGEWLQKCSPFSKSLFTPSTKWKVDININFDGMITEIQNWLVSESICTPEAATEKAKTYAEQIREYSLALYNTANKHAKTKWLTLADTKFEFGLDNESRVTLIDESCTPDSSRYWTTESIVPWQEPEQFDKQAVRDWVMKTWEEMAVQKFLTEVNFSFVDPKEWETKQLPQWFLNAMVRSGLAPEEYRGHHISIWDFEELEKLFKGVKKIALKIPPEIIAIAQAKYAEIWRRFSLDHAQVVWEVTHVVNIQVGLMDHLNSQYDGLKQRMKIEDESEIEWRIAWFTITTDISRQDDSVISWTTQSREVTVNQDTRKTALFLLRLCDEQRMDEFTVSDGVIRYVRAYYGDNFCDSVLQPWAKWHDNLKALLKEGTMFSISRGRQ